MKKHSNLLIAISVVLLVACGGHNRYVINAVCDPALNGQTAYLYDAFTTIATDSAVVRNGRFVMRGVVSDPYMGYLQLEGAAMALIVEPGDIQLDFVHRTLSGTPMNDDYALVDYSDEMSDLLSELEQLDKDYDAGLMNSQEYSDHMMERSLAIAASLDSLRSAHISEVFERNSDNILGVWLVYDIATGDPTMTIDKLRKLLSRSGAVVNRHPLVQSLVSQFEGISSTSPGSRYVDVEGIDHATGKAATLGQLIDGHVAVVDFWASWCGPCRQEIQQTLLPLHQKYADRGVVVVGIDINDNPQRFEAALEQLGITYPQLVDAQGAAAAAYGVETIPMVMVVDQDGTIVARDLRGSAVEEALLSALGE